MLFEWDESKEKRNIVKHGLDFSTAALIFMMSTAWSGLTNGIQNRKIAISR